MVRKGSLQLSINAIVILIMAIAMLGVGIYFIKTVLQGELDGLDGMSDKVKEQIRTQLQQSGEKMFLSGVAGGELIMGQNKENVVSVVIMNQLTSDANFTIEVSKNTPDKDTGDFLGITTFYQTSSQFIAVGDVGEIFAEFETTNDRGRVIYTVNAYQEGVNTPYSSQTFHLVVR